MHCRNGSRQTRTDGVDHHLLIGKLARSQFRVDQFAVGSQLEASAASRDQFQILNLLLEGREQLARQTDGLWLVASHRAVFQFHLHENAPLLRTVGKMPCYQ